MKKIVFFDEQGYAPSENALMHYVAGLNELSSMLSVYKIDLNIEAMARYLANVTNISSAIIAVKDAEMAGYPETLRRIVANNDPIDLREAAVKVRELENLYSSLHTHQRQSNRQHRAPLTFCKSKGGFYTADFDALREYFTIYSSPAIESLQERINALKSAYDALRKQIGDDLKILPISSSGIFEIDNTGSLVFDPTIYRYFG